MSNENIDINENINKLDAKINRVESIFKYYKNHILDTSYTSSGELVFIFSTKKNKLDDFYLCGINGVHCHNDSRIYLYKHENCLKIEDIISNTTRKGYAKALLEYTIKKANEFEVKKIYGYLSNVDSDRHEWLIPFYESLGFKYTFFNDISEKTNGKIQLEISTLPNKK